MAIKFDRDSQVRAAQQRLKKNPAKMMPIGKIKPDPSHKTPSSGFMIKPPKRIGPVSKPITDGTELPRLHHKLQSNK